HEGPVFLTPLQLDTDYQIRLHAPPGGVETLLRRVVASFAAHAPAEALLAVKAHPLDHGWAGWGAKARAAARREGIAERLVFLDGGDLGRMLTGAAGVVVANSTVGLTALQAGVPTIALGTAIYDLPGLAHQSGLDRFWTDPTPPDRERLATFLAALGAIQVPGGFDGTGAKPGAAAAADRMLAPPPY
ncbi:MAG: capsular biosynthesis protein, partial [Pseudomonadota bacterium]